MLTDSMVLFFGRIPLHEAVETERDKVSEQNIELIHIVDAY